MRPFPSFLWAVLTLPFGLAVGFATVVVPFVLRAHGLDMTTIATVSLVVQLPHVIKLLWSPALDAGQPRRSWYFGSVALAALCLSLAALIPPNGVLRVGPTAVALVWIYASILSVAQAAVATSGSAVLTLMALTVPDARRGAASGWQTAGNLVGTATGGALIVWMLAHTSTITTAIALGATCALAASPAAWLDD